MQLSQKIIDTIKSTLVDALNPVRIVIFGSYATGEADEDSDVDIFVVVGNDQSASRETSVKARRALRNAIKGAGLPFDLLLETQKDFERAKSIKWSLESDVEQKGMVIYG